MLCCRFSVYQDGNQHLKSVINVPQLSPIHLVSNIETNINVAWNSCILLLFHLTIEVSLRRIFDLIVSRLWINCYLWTKWQKTRHKKFGDWKIHIAICCALVLNLWLIIIVATRKVGCDSECSPKSKFEYCFNRRCLRVSSFLLRPFCRSIPETTMFLIDSVLKISNIRVNNFHNNVLV